jgi:hypothetical protein
MSNGPDTEVLVWYHISWSTPQTSFSLAVPSTLWSSRCTRYRRPHMVHQFHWADCCYGQYIRLLVHITLDSQQGKVKISVIDSLETTSPKVEEHHYYEAHEIVERVPHNNVTTTKIRDHWLANQTEASSTLLALTCIGTPN